MRFLLFGLLLGACAAPPPPAPPPPKAPPPPPPPAPVAVPEPAPAAPTCPALTVTLPDIPIGGDDPQVPAIARAEGLAHFYERAAAVLRGTAKDHVRIAVFGDSNLTMDFYTGQMRRWLQGKYGDAGHGFVALGKPWSHYRHMDVRHDTAGGFESYNPTTNPVPDSMYGIAGIAAESAWQNAKTWVATADEGAPIGTKASRFDVFYLRTPKTGTFTIEIDGSKKIEIDTRQQDETPSVGKHRLELDDGPHRLDFVASHRRDRVRLFGVAVERPGQTPSFIVDSFGVGALNSRAMAAEDPAVNQAMLRARGYDLVVIATGANDVFTLVETPEHLKKIIRRQREALPRTPILIMSPADRGKSSFPPTLQAVAQRAVLAEETSCPYFSLFDAMGGRDSMSRFKRRGLAMFDYIHFNQQGGAWVGDRLVYALWRGLADHAKQHPRVGCPAGTVLSPGGQPTPR